MIVSWQAERSVRIVIEERIRVIPVEAIPPEPLIGPQTKPVVPRRRRSLEQQNIAPRRVRPRRLARQWRVQIPATTQMDPSDQRIGGGEEQSPWQPSLE